MDQDIFDRLKQRFPNGFVGGEARAIVEWGLTVEAWGFDMYRRLQGARKTFYRDEEVSIIEIKDDLLLVSVGLLYPLAVPHTKFKGYSYKVKNI